MCIAWSCVSRDGVILAEAGSDDGKGRVVRTARRINRMKPTAGWEKTRCWRDAPYRGIKFHLHESATNEDEDGQGNDGQQSRWIIWTFCCVYDSKGIGEECVKSFLTKMVYVTEALRSMPWWREGTALSAQPSFAPTLRQQMDHATQDGRVSMLKQHADETKSIMASNIRQILERGDSLEDLQAEAES